MFTVVLLAVILFSALYYGSNILVIDDTINSMGSFMVTTTEGFTKYEKMPTKPSQYSTGNSIIANEKQISSDTLMEPKINGGENYNMRSASVKNKTEK